MSNARSKNRRMPAVSRVFVAGTLLIAAFAASADEEHELTEFIGAEVSQLLTALGDPTIRTPHELWYSREPRVNGGAPGRPNPGIFGGNDGLSVNGAGGNYEPLTFTRDACDITVTFDRDNLVTDIRQVGPGCFKYVYDLKRQQTETR